MRSEARRTHPRRARAAICLAAGLLAAAAIPSAGAATRAEFDTAYEAVLDNPEDLQAILRFARIAIDLGEYETAVGALEGLMLSVGDVPTIRADLGFLYYRLGSPQIARYHLSAALDSGSLPPDLEERTRDLMQRAENATKRSTFEGSLALGMRYQTNPAAAADEILVSNVPQDPQDIGIQEDDDIDLFGLFRGTHRYDLLTQNKAAIETEMLVFADRYFDQDALDTYVAEITPGIRFEPDPIDNKGITLRPHLIARVTVRDDELHSHALGGGLELRYAASDKLYGEAAFQHRRRNYNNRTGFANVSRRNGYENRLGAAVRYQLRDNLFLGGGARVVDRDSEANYLSSVEVGVNGNLTFNYRASLFGQVRAMSSFASIGWVETTYADPDPLIVGNIKKNRSDHEVDFGIGSTMYLSRAWSMSLEASYTSVNSNIVNFDRDNMTVGLSTVRRF